MTGDVHAIGPVMLDVVGLELSTDDRRRILHSRTGGVILFARNFASHAQLCALVSAIRDLRPGLLITVDHEGGRVQRFRNDGFVRLPAMRGIGALWDADPQRGALNATRAATATGFLLGADLVTCGIDLSFTPVLDLDHGPSAVIGDRAFHRDPRVVALLAKSLMHGLLLAGMANCGKHFPGHGYVAADSHLAIPVDDRDLAAILEDDAMPYPWLAGALTSVMPAHVIYPAVDHRPAGFSPVWLRDILRERLGFEGAIFSDDLSREGASVAGDVVSAGTAALNAGCDMVLVCNDGTRADALLAGLDDVREPASQGRLAVLRAVPVDRRDDRRYARALECLRDAGLVAT
ncbi:MAG: beta-N-acetylhexosaminidase [Burkholderiaceae bacterium]